ncbi:uncharacterized protein LOC116197373 isoform X1 [Punica granatum]|uniref:Uncharacterized protein LOC116197373 isoform X1 n=2 Tax=Punica granatum TaxID=22663 RepID=A0A6P8CPT0_PUNGR|nr:uncharacterized protein LOC116197373 isoform X1 [Punica granatum]XP_031383367.1 uncharacterized protein LOC116197373 isoform X1 [Punica granatum]
MEAIVYNLHPFVSTSVTRKTHNSPSFSTNQAPVLVSSINSSKKKTTTPAGRSPILRMAQNPVTKQQKVVIPNKHGERLVGVLHETGSKEIVILCHGFISNKEDTTMVNLAVVLEKEGITAFRFDFAGNGESEGTFEYGNYWREAEDLRSVVEHFKAENRDIPAVVGHSKGGGVVLLYASKYHDIGAVVNISGRYNMEGGVKERLGEDYMEGLKKDGFIDVKNKSGTVLYRVTMESMMDRLNTNMHEACLQIDKNCRVLTVHGTKDEIIPVGDAIEFSKIIPNHELHTIEEANHGYSSHQTELATAVLRFIKSTLQENKDK